MKKLIIFLSLISMGCNLWSGFDEPKTEKEINAQALTYMDYGKCDEAVKLYNNYTGSLSDDGLHIKGWALLCNAGAPLSKIAQTAFTYNSSTGNLTVLGAMANAILPQNSQSISLIDSALSTFGQIQDVSTKNANLVLAHLVKIGAVIAKQAGNDGDPSKVKGADIAPSNCDVTNTNNCNPASVSNCTAGMSNPDANLLINSISDANSSLNNLGSLGNISALIQALKDLNLGGAPQDAMRCFTKLHFLSE